MVLAVVLLSRSQSPVTQQLDQMCPVQLPSYAWNEAYWIGPNSCPQQGSVTSASCCCIERQPCRGGVGYPSVSAPVSPHFCCCIRRLNPTSRLLMRGSWTWHFSLRHMATPGINSPPTRLFPLSICFLPFFLYLRGAQSGKLIQILPILILNCSGSISLTGAVRWQSYMFFVCFLRPKNSKWI